MPIYGICHLRTASSFPHGEVTNDNHFNFEHASLSTKKYIPSLISIGPFTDNSRCECSNRRIFANCIEENGSFCADHRTDLTGSWRTKISGELQSLPQCAAAVITKNCRDRNPSYESTSLAQ
jgi:hypothetical protein